MLSQCLLFLQKTQELRIKFNALDNELFCNHLHIIEMKVNFTSSNKNSFLV